MADKKQLLAFLKQRGGWLSPADIRASIAGLPDRTLRRWLSELVQEEIIERSGDLKGTRYRWRETAVPPVAEELSGTAVSKTPFTQTSQQHLKRVSAPLYTRSPVTYSEEWVNSYAPNRTFYLSASQQRQLAEAGKRPGIQSQAGTYIQKIYHRLLIDLSYNSSRLEGNTYSLADTERLVLQGIGAEGKLKEEQVMILNHKEAIRFLAHDPAQLPLNEETIRTLHYLLAEGLVAQELAGQIRNDGVLVSGTTYTPLEGKQRLGIKLRLLLEKADLIQTPFEQSFFLLAHLSYLQAFVDVNKRVARLASIIPLIKNDYVPQSFVDADKDDYAKALICFYELNEVLPLAELYCWSYLRTCEHYDTSVQVLGFDEIAVLYRAQRRAMVASIVLSKVSLADAPAYLAQHIPGQIAPQHRDKFFQDVITDLEQLDFARIAGLGIDRHQLQAWLDLRK